MLSRVIISLAGWIPDCPRFSAAVAFVGALQYGEKQEGGRQLR